LVVQRPKSVRIDAQDIKGKKFSLNLKEWQARIFQHEYDHLEVSMAACDPQTLKPKKIRNCHLEARFCGYNLFSG